MGQFSTSEAYVATQSDHLVGPRKVWEKNNSYDAGVISGNANGMVYGATSTFKTDESSAHTRQAYSDALYGGFIHWDAHLTSDDIKVAYDTTRRFYPGHGGVRSPEYLQCGQYSSNEWEQGYLGRHEGPKHSMHLERDDDGNLRMKPSPVNKTKQLSVGLGSFPWSDHFYDKIPLVKYTFHTPDALTRFQVYGGPSEVYCPAGSSFPQHVQLGYYSVNATGSLTFEGDANETQASERPCKAGFFCTVAEDTVPAAGVRLSVETVQGKMRWFLPCWTLLPH